MEAPFKAPGGGGKKKVGNKKVMFLAIGGIIVVVLVLMRRPAASNPDAPTMQVADSYEQFGSPNGGIDKGMSGEEVDGRVTAALNSALSALESDNNAMVNGYFQTSNDYFKDRDEEYVKTLTNLANQNKKYNDDMIARDKADASAAAAQKKLDAAQQAALKKLQDELKKKNQPAKDIKSQPVTNMKPPARKPPVKVVPKPAPKPAPKVTTVKVNYSGNSVVDALKKAGIGSTMTNRAEIAAGNGIKNYTGTASQNTALLKKATSGTLKITPSMKK